MGFSIDRPTNWICPHCQHATTIVPEKILAKNDYLFIPNADGNRCIQYRFIVCPNPECKRFTLDVRLSAAFKNDIGTFISNTLNEWRLIPTSAARTFSAKIPDQILQDYSEACLIKDQSPKASATLARRCLQGMIRDFWGIRKSRLKDEVDALHGHVDSQTWQAIDAVRKVGNIGAHMEPDVNLIINVEPEEAQKLIALIELLIQEWYVARDERQNRVKEVISLAQEKSNEQKGDSSLTDTATGES